MGYTTVDDVCAAFPRFQRNQEGSVSDAQIQGWIDDRAARISSSFLGRGIDLAALVLSADQASFLRALNRDGAISDLSDSLQAGVTLAPGEQSLGQQHRSTFERVLKEIAAGLHDKFFSTVARTTEIKPLFGGTGGAETMDGETPADRGENRSFGKDDVY